MTRSGNTGLVRERVSKMSIIGIEKEKWEVWERVIQFGFFCE